MRRDERGVGTIVTMGIALVLITVAGFGAVLVTWFSLLRDGEHAAELAALAGASAAVRGEGPCDVARDVARENAHDVARCEVRGEGADVVVEVAIAVALEPSLPGAPRGVLRVATAGTM